VIAKYSEADGQALHYEQAAALIARWVVDHLWGACSSAVLDGDSHGRPLPDDL